MWGDGGAVARIRRFVAIRGYGLPCSLVRGLDHTHKERWRGGQSGIFGGSPRGRAQVVLRHPAETWRGRRAFEAAGCSDVVSDRSYLLGIPTVLFPCSETSNFFLLRFALGPAVLESEFRADHESGLRIEQSPRGHYESSV